MPVLSDGTVTLRGHRPGDVDDLVAMGTDPDSTRWTTMPDPYTRTDAERWVADVAPRAWRDGTAAAWAIETGTRFAGNVDVRFGPPPDVGYALAPSARGRGVMARAVRLATRWAFDVAGLPVVHWSTHAGNLASWRVAHACGFTFDGQLPLSIPQRGELRDGWYASLRPGDEQRPRTNWWPIPVLEGPRVRLRPFAERDVPRMVETHTNAETHRFLAHMPDPYTPDAARGQLLRYRLNASLGKAVVWAVTGHDDLLLGQLLVFGMDDPLNPTGGELGYWAHPDARGRGVIAEAVQLGIAHAFTPVADGGLGRHQLRLGTAWPNTGSRRVVERAGFRLVGRTRSDGIVRAADGTEITDGAWYEVLATDRR